MANKLSTKENTMAGIGNLLKLLPTGTVFTFEFLNPVLSNNGTCARPVYKYLTSILIAICGLSCFFSSFIDSYKTKKGKIHYVFATFKGFWPLPSTNDDSDIDSNKYKVRLGDFVHAFLALAVFAVLALLDSNTVGCFYPNFQSSGKKLLMALPPVIGAVSGFVFAVFPNKRRGIGYPANNSSSEATHDQGNSAKNINNKA